VRVRIQPTLNYGRSRLFQAYSLDPLPAPKVVERDTDSAGGLGEGRRRRPGWRAGRFSLRPTTAPRV